MEKAVNYEYECAMTGLTQEGGVADDSDNLGDLPVGWTRVQMTRRAYNPRWIMIQQVKEAMVNDMLRQVPAEMQEIQRLVIAVQVDAQFHPLESDTPVFLPDVDDVVYLSDSGEIQGSIDELRDLLGLDPIAGGADESGDEDSDDDGDEDEAPRISQVGDDEDFDEDEDEDDDGDED